MKRAQVMSKLRVAKKKEKRERRDENKRKAVEAVALGEEVQVKKKTRTIESTRIDDPTFVQPDDQEVFQDEMGDEFASIFRNDVTPKIMITTRPRPSKKLFRFIGDLMQCFPNSYYYPRKTFDVKQICGFANNKNFTHLIVLGEKAKVCNSLIVSRLGTGPTAFFRVSNVEVGVCVRAFLVFRRAIERSSDRAIERSDSPPLWCIYIKRTRNSLDLILSLLRMGGRSGRTCRATGARRRTSRR